MKRSLSFILALIFALGALTLPARSGDAQSAVDLSAARSFTAPFALLAGDANDDGKLNSRDVLLLMKSIVGIRPRKFVRSAADTNGDGAVNAQDVTALMKAVVAKKDLGAVTKERIVCASRDAYVLFEDREYGSANTGIAPGWRLDARGASARTALGGDFGLLADVSSEAGSALIREFNTIAAGRLELTTGASVRGDGFSIEFRNDAGECVYRLFTEGGWRVALPGGESAALADSVDPDLLYRVGVVVDLDGGKARTSIDGGEYVESALLVSTDAANVCEFRFATDEAHTPTALPGAIRVVANYAANDDFSFESAAEFARDWTGDAYLKSSALTLGRGEANRVFEAVGGKVIAETQFILPGGEEFSFGIGSGENAAVTFSAKDGAFFANGEKVYDGFVGNLRYRLRIEADAASSKATIKLNGRTVGETAFSAPCASIDRVFIENASDGEIFIDSVSVCEKHDHDDYVPEPVAQDGGDDSLVGVFTRDLSVGDWAQASALPDFEPLLGYYDDDAPEAADWEIKYLVEHGVDFEAFPLITKRENSTIKPDLNDRLFGAYMNAEYSDMMKYCIVWDSGESSLPGSEEDFIDYYLPFFVENFFKDERYLVVDNMPLVMISNTEWFMNSVGGNTAAANAIIDLEDAAIALGFDGVLIVSLSEWRDEYSVIDIDAYAVQTRSEGAADAESEKALIRKNAPSKLSAIPTASVGENGAANGVRSDLIASKDWLELNEWLRDDFIPKNAKKDWQKGLVLISNWNDFAAGSYIMPCDRLCGFDYLDALRETYTGEKADASLNVVPSAAQKGRICRSYPQSAHALRSLGKLDAAKLEAGTVYVNDLSENMLLPYEIASNGELLIPFDARIGLDHMLRASYDWDAKRGVLTLGFVGHSAVFTVGSETYSIDGAEKPLGFRLYALDGVPMIPIARLCEDVGYSCSAYGGEAHIAAPADAYYSPSSETPAVFAVGKEYQIMFYQAREAYAWIEVDGAEYNDAVGGNMRSAPGIRRISVPQEALDAAKAYSLCVQELVGGRVPYNTKTGAVTKSEFSFAPVPTDRPARAYMIGDAHGDVARPIMSAKTFGGFDFLILNGDITDDCSQIALFGNVYELAAALTGGEKPVVYARGNHENRGAAAELLPDYMPTRDGYTYYTFRLGSIWGIVLDFGEDKLDTDEEFGGGARHAEFRRRETEYLRKVVASAESEYAEEGVEHRIVVVHVPFMYDLGEKYNVDTELFTEWRDMIADIGAELILSCHMHYYRCTWPGNSDFLIDPSCPVSVGSWRSDKYLGGAGYIFDDGAIYVKYVTVDGETVREETITK